MTSLLAFEGDGKIIPHAGGYSDYLARRIKTAERKKAKAAKSTPKAERNRDARTAKLSFKDKHALEKLPGEMAALEKAIAAAEEELADPNLFARDGERFNKLAAQVTADKETLAQKEDQWLELEALREEIEG